jgi:plasmid maintenance system antidote protein VapI
MAVRLSKAFGCSPESWLELQSQYDLAQISRNARKIKVRPFSTRTGLEGYKTQTSRTIA